MRGEPDNTNRSAAVQESRLRRPEIAELLDRGNAALEEAMANQPAKLIRAGDHIIWEGEPHNFVYRVSSGWLARTRVLPDGRKQIILIFLPGDICGLKCMYLRQQPDAIESLSDGRLTWIDHRALRQLLRDNSDVALRILWAAIDHERHLHNWVVGLGQGTAPERMAQMLLDFWRRLKRLSLSTDNTFRVPLSQQQMADYLGLNVVHVNRRAIHRRRSRVAYIVSVLPITSSTSRSSSDGLPRAAKRREQAQRMSTPAPTTVPCARAMVTKGAW
jgi:CRP-like cAMP-binding protein